MASYIFLAKQQSATGSSPQYYFYFLAKGQSRAAKYVSRKTLVLEKE